MSWAGALLLCILMLVGMACAQDELHECVSDTLFGTTFVCLDALFEEDCSLHLEVRVTNTSSPVVSGTINLETSRSLCTSYDACELCAEVEEFHADPLTGTATGCMAVVTRDCLLDFMDSRQQMGCFHFNQSVASTCTACPSGCGGEARGHCDDGMCICEEGWLPPVCTVAADEQSRPPALPQNVTQCIDVGEPLDLSLCAGIEVHDCDAIMEITLNGRQLANATVDLIREEQLEEAQCVEVYPGCSTCVMVDEFQLYYSEELQANFFNSCLLLTFDYQCFSLLDVKNLLIDVGCVSVPADECHLCDSNCNGHGNCTAGICDCFEGYSGLKCESALCPNNCTDNGICYDGICDCLDLFYGDDCSNHCTQTISGVHLNSNHWYDDETAVADEPWKGWLEVSHNTGGLSIGVGSVNGTESDSRIRVLVRKDCPPTPTLFDHHYDVNLDQDGGEMTEEFLNVFDKCNMKEPHGTWFFAVICLSGDECPFRFNIWTESIKLVDVGVKSFGDISYPHSRYYVFSSVGLAEVTLLLKVQPSDPPVADPLRLIGRFGDCPDAKRFEFAMSEPEAIDSSVYDVQYSLTFTSTETGRWYLGLESVPECDSNCPVFDFSLLATSKFVCDPPCANGGDCSQVVENTCICAEGYVGSTCDEFDCFPMCVHGTCVDANVCRCDEGWMGPTCIDVDHGGEAISYGHFAEATSGSTVAIIGLCLLFMVLSVVVLAAFTLRFDGLAIRHTLARYIPALARFEQV